MLESEGVKILHLCWGLEPNNGAANIARLIMGEQRAAGHVVDLKSAYTCEEIAACDELWCHCGWYWRIWQTVHWAKKLGKVVRWMPECCYDPVRLNFHGWKKRLVGPLERWSLRKCDTLVATCLAEAKWIKSYVGPDCPPVEVSDIRRFFDLKNPAPVRRDEETPLKILYLGRPHPLKGVEFLRRAIFGLKVELHEVSGKFGAALEAEWVWADVLCLPTLSDNFGLVVAEALERGKRVITTDGAPAWENQPGVVYLKGYRDGTDECRVELLRQALKEIIQ